jgi:C1A family cysteine protease
MALFAFLTCLQLVAAHSHKDWEDWKLRYGRRYASSEEELVRREIFTQNMAKADEMQKANPLAVFGSDEFSDWTEEEEQANLFGAIPEEPNAEVPEAFVNMSVQIPTSIDWTGKATTPIKKQKCGSCWANSAIEQIESDFMLQKNRQFILSPQEAVDCKGDRSFRNGCKGGWPDGAYQAFQQLGGIDLEKDYPDQGTQGKSKTPIDTKCMYKQQTAAVTISGWQFVGRNSEAEMKQYVGTSGPLSVCLLAAFKGYKKGILTGCPSNKGTNHCVQIVGYGTEHGQAYWKVRNSWGANWAEDGFIRIAYGSNQCDINSHPTSTKAGKILKETENLVV